MATAQELIDNPDLFLDPVTDPGPDKSDVNELLHMHLADDDIRDIALKIYGVEKTALIQDIRSVVTDASFQDSITQANTLTLVLFDPDWELLNTGMLDHVIDINPGGIPHRWYRLDRVDVNDDTITLTFITRNAAYLSYHKRPYKISRNKVTRAEFILTLLHHVRKNNISFFCPQLHKVQKKATLSEAERSKKKRDANRESGFSARANITVKGQPADSKQRQNIEDVLTVGSQMNAPPMALVGAIMTIIQEAGASRNPQPPNPPYVGLFQQNRAMGWPATGDPFKDAPAFYKKFIPKVKANPNSDLGPLIAQVQGVVGSTNPLNFGYALAVDRWRQESERAVKAFDPSAVISEDPGTTVTDSQTVRGRFEFMVGEPDGPKNENYMAAIYRLADEVHWSAFWVRDVLHFQSQEDLFKSRARARIRRFQDGVEGVQFSWDRSKPLNEMTITVRMVQWFAPIGTVVIFDEGGPAQGRWLVTDITRSMFSQLGTITLSKPIVEKLEPLKETTSRPSDGSSSDSTPSEVTGSPKQIIDTLVIPKAQSLGRFMSGSGQGPLTPDSVYKANQAHKHLGDGSDHAGWKSHPPGLYKYAVDMSIDWVDHTEGTAPKEMLEMAHWLVDTFNLSGFKDTCHDGHDKEGRYRFQICYLMSSAQAGDHFNHIHFGIQDHKPGSAASSSIGGATRREPNLPEQPPRTVPKPPAPKPKSGKAWNDASFGTDGRRVYANLTGVPVDARVSDFHWYDAHHTISNGPYIP